MNKLGSLAILFLSPIAADSIYASPSRTDCGKLQAIFKLKMSAKFKEYSGGNLLDSYEIIPLELRREWTDNCSSSFDDRAHRRLSKTTRKESCKKWKTKFAVKPQISWGTISSDLKNEWISLDCDSFFTTKLDTTVTSKSDKEICLNLMRDYDVVPYQSFGSMSENLKTVWKNSQCDEAVKSEVSREDWAKRYDEQNLKVLYSREPFLKRLSRLSTAPLFSPHSNLLYSTDTTVMSSNSITFKYHRKLAILGVFSMDSAKAYSRRMLIRETQNSARHRVSVVFVICYPILSLPEHLYWELISNEDILFLNCVENMNNGKSYEWFRYMYKLALQYQPRFSGPGAAPFRYVLKSDDDTYVHLKNLERSLERLPEDNFGYFGLRNYRNKDPEHSHFMVGMLYGISWRLVKRLVESRFTVKDFVGYEDNVMSVRLRQAVSKGGEEAAEITMYHMVQEIEDEFFKLVWANETETNVFERVSNKTIAIHPLKLDSEYMKAHWLIENLKRERNATSYASKGRKKRRAEH